MGIGQADVGRGRSLGTEPLQEDREHVCQPVEAPHVGSVSGEAGEPVGPIVAGMVVDGPEVALLVQDARQVEGHHLLVGEAQVGVGGETLGMNPKTLIEVFADKQVEGDELSLPIYKLVKAGSVDILG